MSYVFPSIKKLISTIFVVFLASGAVTSQASGPIYYVVIDKNGNEQAFDDAPVDLSYPPPGEKLKVIDISKGEKNEGVPISAQEQASRLDKPRVIITNKPDRSQLLTSQERARLEFRDANVRVHQNRAGRLFDGAISAHQIGMHRTGEKFEKAAEREYEEARKAGSARGKW